MTDEDALTPEQQLRFERLITLGDRLITVTSREGITPEYYNINRQRFIRAMEAAIDVLGFPHDLVHAIMPPPARTKGEPPK